MDEMHKPPTAMDWLTYDERGEKAGTVFYDASGDASNKNRCRASGTSGEMQ